MNFDDYDYDDYMLRRLSGLDKQIGGFGFGYPTTFIDLQISKKEIRQ